MRRFYENHGFNFDPRLFELGGEVVIRGYWQSFRYLVDLRPALKAEFSPSGMLSREAGKMLMRIKSCHSIGMHIRRGDYLNGWPVLGDDYYSRALDLVAESSHHAAHLFVFTNDAAWCSEHLLPNREKTVVSSPSILPHEDLFLLTACRSIIMANSTFSWWGAYLADAPEMVVAPQGWIFRHHKGFRQGDIYPGNWHVVECAE
jgi:hypothetical protein